MGNVLVFEGQDALFFVDQEHLGFAKVREDGGKFTTNHTRTQDHDALREVRQRRHAVAGHDDFFVDRNVGQIARAAAHRHDRVLSPNGLLGAFGIGDVDVVFRGEFGVAVEKRQLPRFLEIRNLLLELHVLFGHGAVCLVHDAREMHLRVIHRVAQIGVVRELVAFRQFPQRFG